MKAGSVLHAITICLSCSLMSYVCLQVRVKDVLTEFYAILIDLFDSYAFMGSLVASVQGGIVAGICSTL